MFIGYSGLLLIVTVSKILIKTVSEMFDKFYKNLIRQSIILSRTCNKTIFSTALIGFQY